MEEDVLDVLATLQLLEEEASLAATIYMESKDPNSNVISIAPGSPARNMWETRMALIQFVWEHSDLEIEE